MGQFPLFDFPLELSIGCKQFAGALLYQFFKMIAIFIQLFLYLFAFFYFLFNRGYITVAGTLSTILAVSAINGLANMIDPTFPAISGDYTILKRLGFSGSRLVAEMLSNAIPVGGMDDLIQQIGLFLEFINAIT